MALTRQQKTYGMVLALALGGLGVDRFVIGYGEDGPSSAQASEAKPTQSATPTATVSASATSSFTAVRSVREGADLEQLSELLNSLYQEQGPQSVSDAFQTPHTWVSSPTQATPTPAVWDAQAYIQRHRLQAVSQDATGATALINGQFYRPGQEIDGMILRDINADSVLLVRGDEGVRLSVHRRR